MTDLFSGHVAYALAWASFGLLHSLLARQGVQARLRPVFGAGYRLAYNVFAVLHFALVALVGHVAVGAGGGFDLPGWASAAMWALHGLGWIVMLGAARGYDLDRFLGTAQLRRRDEPEDEPLRLDGAHRWVRHPLYAGAYLILWGAAQAPLGLATAVWGSLYLAIGTWFEERKLLRLYGEAYADYRRRVPAVVPWRGRGA